MGYNGNTAAVKLPFEIMEKDRLIQRQPIISEMPLAGRVGSI